MVLSFTPAALGAEPVVTQTPFDRNLMFRAAMADFFAAVRGEGVPRASLDDGLAALRIVDAIKASFANGAPVRIAA